MSTWYLPPVRPDRPVSIWHRLHLVSLLLMTVLVVSALITETDYERHSREAQDLLERANSADWCEVQPAQEWLAKAQVHATLALAAATRANRTVTVREDRP